MNTTSQNISINDIQNRISELDAIVDKIDALKAERDDLKRALPALLSMAQRSDLPPVTSSVSVAELQLHATGRPYSPKAGTSIARLCQILADHPEGIAIPEIIQAGAQAGAPLKYSSVSSQLSQLRKRKFIKKVKGLFSLR